MDEYAYYECIECSFGISGDPFSTSMLRKMDEHERQPGHVLQEVRG